MCEIPWPQVCQHNGCQAKSLKSCVIFHDIKFIFHNLENNIKNLTKLIKQRDLIPLHLTIIMSLIFKHHTNSLYWRYSIFQICQFQYQLGIQFPLYKIISSCGSLIWKDQDLHFDRYFGYFYCLAHEKVKFWTVIFD